MVVAKFSFIVESTCNQPKLCPSASWNGNGMTFADLNSIGSQPSGIFVDTNNTVLVATTNQSVVQRWLEGNTTLIDNIVIPFGSPVSVFGTSNSDLYVGYSSFNAVTKNSFNSTTAVIAMYVNGSCYSIFVDAINNVYCSLQDSHQVVKRSVYDDDNTTTVIAGNGSSGSAANLLFYPQGIFVDVNFTLYVADCSNSRVQQFRPNSLSGSTIVGSEVNSTIVLYYPTGIVLDADGYVFISDSNNHRIIGSGPNGLRCIVGCTNTSGWPFNQLAGPIGLNFDTYGNLFVLDQGNNRIQKFLLVDNSCSKRGSMSHSFSDHPSFFC